MANAGISKRSAHQPVPLVVAICCSFTCGIAATAIVDTRAAITATIATTWWLCSVLLHRRQASRLGTVSLLTFVFCLGALHWQVSQAHRTRLRDLAKQRTPTVRLICKIDSVPTTHEKPVRSFDHTATDSQHQTRFRAQSIAVQVNNLFHTVSESCLVYIEADASQSLAVNDEVELLGQLDWPRSPGNPGEFDFGRYLKTHGISALVFVRHPDAIRMRRPSSRFNPWRGIGLIRREIQSVIRQHVDRDSQAIALALLLGDRNQLPSETELSFVTSGTMHLLAISGLHVGILCWFILRICSILIIGRRHALLITLAICACYALVTDLRPSVVRATIFFAVFVVCELTVRRCSFVQLITITALTMLVLNPALVFDAGAWLSFLSVGALAWVESRKRERDAESHVPMDPVGLKERMKKGALAAGASLMVRYRQMFAILGLTAPVIVMIFHVISPIGLVLNIILIPLTAGVLCLGFVTLVAGILIPYLAFVPAKCFSAGLFFLDRTVDTAAGIGTGHVYVPDLAPAFFVTYYTLVAVFLFSRSAGIRYVSAFGVFATTSAAFAGVITPVAHDNLRCTVLDIGHGSAAVIEFDDGKVLLVDAGALNQGERAADSICRFLWHHGYRKLNGLLISHADADHYNAVAEILKRIPVAEIETSKDFVRTRSPGVQSLLNLIAEHEIPIRLLNNREGLVAGQTRLTVFTPDLPMHETSDNERSVVVQLTHANQKILLPGDLEGRGLTNLLPDLSNIDVLVSPHHGSPAANTRLLRDELQPQHLIVSARDAAATKRLHRLFQQAESIRFTHDSGAVTVTVGSDGAISIRDFTTRIR